MLFIESIDKKKQGFLRKHRKNHLFPRGILCLLWICLFAFSGYGQAKYAGLDQRIDYPAKSSSVATVLDVLQQQSGHSFFYDKAALTTVRLENMDLRETTLKKALIYLEEAAGLSFLVTGKNIAVSKGKAAGKRDKITMATAGIISGVILEEGSNTPLQHVTVHIKGSNTTVSSDEGGIFRLAASGNTVLEFSHVGYRMKEMSVSPAMDLRILLEPIGQSMNAVVVTGYGETKKVNLTGAVDQVGSEYFENRPMPNVARGLEGAVPNLNIKMTDGKPIRSATYNIRGVTSIGGGGSALILIDGVPGDPSTLNPNDIESVSVLKDASSAAIYGARGAFGVVLITTKKPAKNKTQVNYSGNYSINKRTTNLDLIADSYIWAKYFDESFNAWNDYLSRPTTIGSILPFSPAYLEELKAHSEDPSLPKVTVDPATGKFLYYANTDWHKELYKDNNATMEHALSISGGNDKAGFLISGRYFHQDGIFRYNTDKFNRYNLRFKGSIQVNDWLSINTNSDFSNYTYQYPLTSVGGLAAVWRTMSSTAYPVAPLLNPDGSLTSVGAYAIGDFYYGKSYSNDNQNFLRNTIAFTASIIKDRLTIKGDVSHLWTNTDKRRKFFTVPYSTTEGQMITSGLN